MRTTHVVLEPNTDGKNLENSGCECILDSYIIESHTDNRSNATRCNLGSIVWLSCRIRHHKLMLVYQKQN